MVRKTMVKDGKTYEMTRFIVRCDICHERVESVHPEVIILCSCGNLCMRGGIEQGGHIGCMHDLITDLSEWVLVE